MRAPPPGHALRGSPRLSHRRGGLSRRLVRICLDTGAARQTQERGFREWAWVARLPHQRPMKDSNLAAPCCHHRAPASDRPRGPLLVPDQTDDHTPKRHRSERPPRPKSQCEAGDHAMVEHRLDPRRHRTARRPQGIRCEPGRLDQLVTITPHYSASRPSSVALACSHKVLHH